MRKKIPELGWARRSFFSKHRQPGKIDESELERFIDMRRISIAVYPLSFIGFLAVGGMFLAFFLTVLRAFYLLIILAAMTLFSKFFRNALLLLLKLPFSVSRKLVFFLASPSNALLLNKLVEHQARLPRSEVPKPQLALGYSWRGTWIFGGFRRAGLTLNSIMDGVVVVGSHGTHVVRRIVNEVARNQLGVLLFDTSGRIGVPMGLRNPRVHRIGIDTTINPMEVKGVSMRGWSSAFATAASVAGTLDLEDARMLGDFFFTRGEQEGVLRITQTRLWVEGIGEYIDPHRAFTIKANIKKLLLGRAENIFADDGVSVHTLIPSAGELEYLDLAWMDREQKTFLLVFLLGILQHLEKPRSRPRSLVIVIDDLQNLLPEMNMLPYDYRPVWESLMHLVMTTTEVAGLVLCSQANWLTTYAYSLLPNTVVTAVRDPGSARDLSQVLSLGREGEELLMGLAPQESLVKTTSRFGPSYFMMLANPVKAEKLPPTEIRPRQPGRRASKTSLGKDFESRAEVAYEILKTASTLVEPDLGLVRAYATKYPANEVVETINLLRSNAYLVEVSKGRFEISEKGFKSLEEWASRNFSDPKADLSDDELWKRLDEPWRRLLDRAEEQLGESQYPLCIRSCREIVRRAFQTLLGKQKVTGNLAALLPELGKVGLSPCREEELTAFEELSRRAKVSDLVLSRQDAESCMKLVKRILSRFCLGWQP